MIKNGNISKLEVIGLFSLCKTGEIGDNWVLKVVDTNEDGYDEEYAYKVISLEHPKYLTSYWKINGFYDSYEGNLHWDYSSAHEVTPQKEESKSWSKI